MKTTNVINFIRWTIQGISMNIGLAHNAKRNKQQLCVVCGVALLRRNVRTLSGTRGLMKFSTKRELDLMHK